MTITSTAEGAAATTPGDDFPADEANPVGTALPAYRPFTRLLVANRGEIARRVIRAARAVGIESVAIAAAPDHGAPHVREADLAVLLPGRAAATTYLDVDTIIDAARRSGAQAVHPGYGFLAESPRLARAVQEAGLVWVGPPPAAIEAMGLKVPAKEIAAAAGFPLPPAAPVPADISDDDLVALGDSIGYPLLVKASAGGGGTGMKRVAASQDLVAAHAVARREALAAFGDATVFLERVLTGARHVEIQVVADAHGGVAHLFERDCSVQRRHQKVIEEAPAPDLAPHVSSDLRRVALELARRIGYVGLGTIEVLVSGTGADQGYAFLEMNTRLQVEHPVTEEVTGVDLVALQLRVAAGERLPAELASLQPRGHSVEARVYAEIPAAGYRPNPGTVTAFDIAGASAFGLTDGLRLDAALDGSGVVPAEFDPMIAKVIAYGDTRDAAIARLRTALAGATIHGLATNRDQLVAILDDPDLRGGRVTTAWLDARPDLAAEAPDAVTAARHRAAVVAAGVLARRATAPALGFLTSGWRITGPVTGATTLTTLDPADPGPTAETARYTVRACGRDHLTLELTGPDGEAIEVGAASAKVHVEADGGTRVRMMLTVDGVGAATTVTSRPATPGPADEVAVRHEVDDPRWHTAWLEPAPFPDPGAVVAGGGPTSPLPGTVTAVLVSPGDVVTTGQVLVVVEAMKMEHPVAAAGPGRVVDVLVEVGRSVEADRLLVVLEPLADQAAAAEGAEGDE